MLSVLIVALNAGDDLRRTVESTLSQQNADFEIIVKDGGSTDGSLEKLPVDQRLRIISKKDTGIYNAMNQAAELAEGEFALFMNCGDVFYDDMVLCQIENFCKEQVTEAQTIIYGDCYTENRDVYVRYPDVFDDYVCLTKTLCHQATVYPTAMLKRRGFQEQYRIAADYEYYVDAYSHGCKMIHIPLVIVRYQGNGASETPKNLKKSIKDANYICRENLGAERYRKAWFKAQLHGFGLKRFLVQQGWFYPVYKKLAKIYYRNK